MMLVIPDELSLLEFFEAEPHTADPDDGYFCYKAIDKQGIAIYFGFNFISRSVQVRLELGQQEIACVFEEGATKIAIETDASGSYIKCLFGLGEVAKSKLSIYLQPEISLDWSTLICTSHSQ